MPKYTDQILNAREVTHGDWNTTASVSQLIKDAIASAGSERLSPQQAEALDLIATKIARIVSGNPDAAEHWDDIAGYAKLVSSHLVDDLL